MNRISFEYNNFIDGIEERIEKFIDGIDECTEVVLRDDSPLDKTLHLFLLSKEHTNITICHVGFNSDLSWGTYNTFGGYRDSNEREKFIKKYCNEIINI